MVPANINNNVSSKVKSDEIVQSVRHKELMGAIESLRAEITHLKTQQAELTSRFSSLEGRMSGVKDDNTNTLLFEELSKLRKDLTTFHIHTSCPQIASLELNNSSLTTVDNDETMSAYDDSSPSVSEKDDCFVEMSITDYMKHKKASITLIDKTSCHTMKSTRVQTSCYDFTMLFEEHEVIRKL